ncbi:hypothetical protein BGX23_010747 [Mortierella sp. AD031]|nr:hypothetical protein BGX23_010747 [Mortierella sp. AD031]KAG0206788.1 hypothetical protein BGX33_007213 [Mortierella sp. NVP41]
MGSNRTAGEPAGQEAQPLLSEYNYQHAEGSGSGSFSPSSAQLPKTSPVYDKSLLLEDELSGADGQSQQRVVVSEAERLALLESLPWYRRPSIIWLISVVFMLALMMGISAAPEEQQINIIICRDYLRGKGRPVIGGKDDVCKTPEVQAVAALVTSRLSFVRSIAGIFTVGFYTSQSDRRGRKFLIYMTLVPAVFSQMLIIHMGRPNNTLGLWVLYANAFISGCLGAGSLLEPGMNAYIADCTPRDKRSLAIGHVMVTMSIGLIIGQFTGVTIIKWTGTEDVSAALEVAVEVAVFLIFYTMILPESRPKEARIADAGRVVPRYSTEPTSFRDKMKQLVTNALEPLLLFLPGRIEPTENELPSRYTILLLIAAYALGQFAINGLVTVFIPYTNLVYDWTSIEDGYYFILFGVSTFVVYLVIFPGMQYIYNYFSKSTTNSIMLPSDKNRENEQVAAAMLHEVSSNTGVHIAVEAVPPTISSEQDGTVGGAKEQGASIKKDLSFMVFGAVLNTLSSCGMGALASVGLTSFTSLMTTYVPSHQTGKALGGICILDVMLSAVASLLYGWIFAKTSGTVPSAVYIVSMGLWIASIGVTMVILAMYRRRGMR